MREDPRHRNKGFDLSGIGQYLDGYADRLRAALDSVDRDALDAASRLIVDTAAAERRIYAVGNGGSAAIADHLCCDWVKGTHVKGHPVIDTMSLTSNVALYSALANDFGFENAFSSHVGFVGKAGDTLIAISSSGESPNILNAVDAARHAGMRSIGFTGFTGGALRSAADISIHIDADNYGIVEDAHQVLMHVIAQFIEGNRPKGDTGTKGATAA